MPHIKEIEEQLKVSITLFDRRALPFPNNEQMVYNTAEDLKAKFKTIISRNTFDRNR
jgi:hypothetical protein